MCGCGKCKSCKLFRFGDTYIYELVGRESERMSYFMVTSDGKELCMNCGQRTEQEGVFISFKDREQGIRCDECKDYFNGEKVTA